VISAYTAELKYIRNVSPTTLDLYKYSFQAFKDALESRATVVARVAELRDKGMKPVTVNTYLRCIDAYFMWLHKEHGKERVKIPWLQDEQKILITFSAAHVKALIHWKPVKRADLRLHVLALTALDTGLRVAELLSLKRVDVDFQNFTLRVVGKGNKHRLPSVPT
jgi:integrase/recombinase XerD